MDKAIQLTMLDSVRKMLDFMIEHTEDKSQLESYLLGAKALIGYAHNELKDRT